MKPLTKDSPGIVIELRREDMDESYEAQFDDAETVAWIRAELASGNEWAWSVANVRVSYHDVLVASDWLGGCSYESEADFRAGGYFTDMVDSCIADINAKRAKVCDCPMSDDDYLLARHLD